MVCLKSIQSGQMFLFALKKMTISLTLDPPLSISGIDN